MLPALVMTLVLGAAAADERPSYPDLPGPYCETRKGAKPMQCCSDRMDPCSVSILDTLCYCDEFCDRGASGDCCPDYFSFCRGETEPRNDTRAVCTYNGDTYFYGDTTRENCNICTCSGEETSPTMECEEDACLVEPILVEVLNQHSDHGGWTAHNYSRFWGRKLAEGELYLTGTDYPARLVDSMFPVTKTALELPRQFDARRKWPGLVGSVVDQGWCGSSWAVSSATVAADRLSIQRGRRTELSAQNILDCAEQDTERHCRGGSVDSAWNFLRLGKVAEESCYPYTARAWAASGECRTVGEEFTLTCRNGSRLTLRHKQLQGMQPSYRIAGERDIRQEIFTAGPVQAILRVHRDLFLYRSGVYWVTGNLDAEAPYHSVRLIGWGEQNTISGQRTKYWLAANSWGHSWGESGLLRIKRGTNEADIERFVVGAWAQLPHQQTTNSSAT